MMNNSYATLATVRCADLFMACFIEERLCGTTMVFLGNSRASFAALSAASLPLMLMWLGSQMNLTSVSCACSCCMIYRMDVTRNLLSSTSLFISTMTELMESVKIWMIEPSCGNDSACLRAIRMALSSA